MLQGETPHDSDFRDAVVQGIDNTFTDWEDWFGVALGPTSTSRKLGRAMTKGGRPRPSPLHDAHHIVPAEDKRFPEAVEAREILGKSGIDLYNSSNGVWLPRKRGITSGAYHPDVHNADYYREVLRRLSEAGTREKAILSLTEIGRALENGPFPE